MDDKGRGFKALNIAPRSHLAGKGRFPKKANVESPSVAWYRNNLTALSQYYNLLFIAFNDSIHVHQPQYPNQIILNKPQFEFKLEKTNEDLEGYIDQAHPHAANHLVVGDLGNEEILITACDDGDVVAYSTRQIYNAIKTGYDIRPSLPEPVRPFFKRNVGKSAWGIAIHKEARLIAISANTRQITIFAFAISQRSPSESQSSSSDEDIFGFLNDPPGIPYQIQAYAGSPGQRSFDQEIILKGHTHNIPNIAFCNTDDDPLGRYLVSTDIDGSTNIWDIWKGTILMKASERPKHATPASCVLGNWRHGWAVACLNPCFCRLASGNVETYGLDVSRYLSERFGVHVDNSASLEHVPDSSRWHPSYSRYTAVPNVNHPPDPETGSDEDTWESPSDDEENEDESDGDMLVNNPLHNNSPEYIPPIGPVYLFQLPHSPETSLLSPSPILTPSSQPPQSQKIAPLPFHLFQSFETNILLSHNLLPQSPPSTSSLTMSQLFNQSIPPSLHWLHHINRINMLLQIPELGVVALATQAGRVALLTMTVMKQRSKSKEEKAGFRVDWLLPLKSQEDKGMRPESPLLGMAVGPVQGMEMVPESRDEPREDGGREAWRAAGGSRRYRLMMFYYDHTVLSYEIWRSEGDENDEPVLVI